MWELKTPVVVLFLLGILHLACLASSANCFSHATVSYLNIMQSMQSCAWEDLVSKVGCIPSKAGRGHYPDKTMHDHGVATENWKICIDDLFPVHHLFLQFFSRPCCNPQLCSTRPSRPSSRILAARIDDYVLFQHPKLVFLFFCHNIKRNGAGSVADSGSEKLEIVLSHLYNPAQHILYPTQCVLHSRHHFVWTKRNMFCTTWNMFFCVCFASWTHTHTHTTCYFIPYPTCSQLDVENTSSISMRMPQVFLQQWLQIGKGMKWIWWPGEQFATCYLRRGIMGAVAWRALDRFRCKRHRPRRGIVEEILQWISEHFGNHLAEDNLSCDFTKMMENKNAAVKKLTQGHKPWHFALAWIFIPAARSMCFS